MRCHADRGGHANEHNRSHGGRQFGAGNNWEGDDASLVGVRVTGKKIRLRSEIKPFEGGIHFAMPWLIVSEKKTAGAFYLTGWPVVRGYSMIKHGISLQPSWSFSLLRCNFTLALLLCSLGVLCVPPAHAQNGCTETVKTAFFYATSCGTMPWASRAGRL